MKQTARTVRSCPPVLPQRSKTTPPAAGALTCPGLAPGFASSYIRKTWQQHSACLTSPTKRATRPESQITAKAGVLALTKSAAQEYGRQGIRVNALVAGAFDTPMLNHSLQPITGGDAQARERTDGLHKSMIALARFDRPEEAPEAIVWPCSAAAAYVTGHSMIVDGGLTTPFR
jgi:NAD(P)-dependent dehydrogenase (short-subunit alcohol dehydrogenase family)